MLVSQHDGLYLGHVFHCPIILFSPIGFASHWTRLVGNVENPSYQVELSMKWIEPMTFWQRLLNSMVYYMQEWMPYHEQFTLPLLQEKRNMTYDDYLNTVSNINADVVLP